MNHTYIKALDNLAKNNCKDIFPNTELGHAKSTLAMILKHYNEEIILFDDNIINNLTTIEREAIRTLIIEAITYKKRITIIADQIYDNQDINIFLSTLQDLYPHQVSIKTASDNFKNIFNEANQNLRFVIGDHKMFRIEQEKYPLSWIRWIREWKASFNSPVITADLLQSLNTQYSSCKDYFSDEIK